MDHVLDNAQRLGYVARMVMRKATMEEAVVWNSDTAIFRLMRIGGQADYILRLSTTSAR